uniref:Uncharacterized protein n=1 Tax=Romanomermis culicivorax TaxID=13658 RepID=A0A915HRW3_ROMCU
MEQPPNASILWALSLPSHAVILTEKLRRLGECRAKAAMLSTFIARHLESDLCTCGMHRHVAALMIAAVFTIISAALSLAIF